MFWELKRDFTQAGNSKFPFKNYIFGVSVSMIEKLKENYNIKTLFFIFWGYSVASQVKDLPIHNMV